jgi:hypothetical protein
MKLKSPRAMSGTFAKMPLLAHISLLLMAKTVTEREGCQKHYVQQETERRTGHWPILINLRTYQASKA